MKRQQSSRAVRTEHFLTAHPQHPATKFFRAAETAGIPLSTAAEAGGLSRWSVYLWVCGDVEPRAAQVTILGRVTRALLAAVEAGELPLADNVNASRAERIAAVTRYL